MAIDAGIYNQLNIPDPMAGANAIGLYQQAKNDKVDRANKLAQLAQQQELQGYQLNEARRKEAAVPQQQADAEHKRQGDIMKAHQQQIAMGANSDEAIQAMAAEAANRGISPENIAETYGSYTKIDPSLRSEQAKSHVTSYDDWIKTQTKHDEVVKEFQVGDKYYVLTKSGIKPAEVNGQQLVGTVKPTTQPHWVMVEDASGQHLVDANDPNTPRTFGAKPKQSSSVDSNKPPSGYRYTQSGDLQAIPGGPADIKEQQKSTAQETGRENVSTTIAALRDAYTQLNENGGITDPTKGGGSNLFAGLASSGAGQATGRLFGTQNQSKRNEILMTRPALLQHIMKATGMSAKQMDSNAELKLWLATATDPTLDISANMTALDRIEKTYGLSGANSGNVPNKPTPHKLSSDAEYNALPSGAEYIAPDGSHRRKK